MLFTILSLLLLLLCGNACTHAFGYSKLAFLSSSLLTLAFLMFDSINMMRTQADHTRSLYDFIRKCFTFYVAVQSNKLLYGIAQSITGCGKMYLLLLFVNLWLLMLAQFATFDFILHYAIKNAAYLMVLYIPFQFGLARDRMLLYNFGTQINMQNLIFVFI